MPDPLRIGIVGACGRGASFRAALAASGIATLHAVCDTNTDRLEATRAELNAPLAFHDYEQMLDRAGLDAVIVATPMHLHVPQSIAALARGIAVLSEVTAGVSIDECRRLALACRASPAVYMLAENYIHTKPNTIVREIARRGLFGTTYFADAEYVHEIKPYVRHTPWRRKWQLGINGNTYCTHSLGPVLQWMPGQRVTQVCCAGAGTHHRDPDGIPFEQEASTLTLCRTNSGGLIKLRLDLQSDRPHAMTNYQLQGLDGCYESARAPGDPDRIWLRSLSPDPNRWTNLRDLEAEFLPESWKRHAEAARASGHGGGDFFVILEFLQAVQGLAPPSLGIEAALDMTLPGLCSQLSIVQGGRWIDVPDPRAWTQGLTAAEGQLYMTFPPELPAPEIRLPPGYLLRPLRPADHPAYAALMQRAGFGSWDDARIRSVAARTLEDGILVIEHQATGGLAATALANLAPTDRYPHHGELGWVAGDPNHAGKGLGLAACAAVIHKFRQHGIRRIYLSTDDHRLPAIATYLKLGFLPDLYKPDHPARWDAVRQNLRP